MSRREPRSPRRRPRPRASSRANPSTSTRAKSKAAAGRRCRNASGWMQREKSLTRSIGCLRAKAPSRSPDDSPSRDNRDREPSASRNRSERAYSAEYGWSRDSWREAPQGDTRGNDIQRWDREQRWDSWDNAPRWRDNPRGDWQRADPTYFWGSGRYN